MCLEAKEKCLFLRISFKLPINYNQSCRFRLERTQILHSHSPWSLEREQKCRITLFFLTHSTTCLVLTWQRPFRTFAAELIAFLFLLSSGRLWSGCGGNPKRKTEKDKVVFDWSLCWAQEHTRLCVNPGKRREKELEKHYPVCILCIIMFPVLRN